MEISCTVGERTNRKIISKKSPKWKSHAPSEREPLGNYNLITSTESSSEKSFGSRFSWTREGLGLDNNQENLWSRLTEPV